MTSFHIPPNAWDVHVHCLDPDRFPYKPSRTYTPQPAPLKSLFSSLLIDNIVLVQASVEDGETGLLQHLDECREEQSTRLARGIIATDLQGLSPSQFDRYHEAGVRGIRIHGSHGGLGDDLDWVRAQLTRAARLYPVKNYDWCISAQLPLKTWSSLADDIVHDRGSELANVTLVADHNGMASPADIDSPELDNFLRLVASGKVYVKIGALHRRSPGDLHAMRPLVQLFAEKAPRRILWGSDWPHVDASSKGLLPAAPMQGVGTVEELEAIHSWLTPRQWSDMLVANPERFKTLDVMQTYRSYSHEYSKEVERKLVRRIDLHILPLVVTMYLFNYLDRNSITQARLGSIQKDTGVDGVVWNTAISIFSAGYIAMQLPSTLLMTKTQPHIFLPGCIILWAIVSGSTAATTSPGGLLAVRFILGLVEAPFFPGAIYFLSCWYTKKELGVRMALLICGILLSNSFAGLISAGILYGMSSIGGLAGWRWLFILEGLATIIVGVAAFFLLPDYPATTKWLTEEEKIVARGRLAADAGSEDILDEEDVSMWKGIQWAAKDHRVGLFACLQMATTASISFSHFFPTTISELGFSDTTVTLLLTSPPYMFAFFWSLGMAYSADRMQKRSPYAAVSAVVAIVATLCEVVLTDQTWARYGLTFVVCAGSFGVYSTTYTWLSSTVVRPPVKRAAAIGIANTLANVASLFGNYFWLDEYQPWYRQSWGAILAFQVLGLACILALRFSLKRANAKFEKLGDEVSPEDEAAVGRMDHDSQRAVLNGFRFIT
ncbi:major facilitator superfamily domain-containing protein [Hypoxylon sp. FL1150]|nr:major facilitator superfamily domain-containing protein [Hypoxylon sp. FL1150]